MAIRRVVRAKRGELHSNNPHRGAYDIAALCESYPELSRHIFVNKYGTQTIDFFKSEAVRALNSALLAHYYHIEGWEFADGALVPPIPSRADYIHYLADLVGDEPNVRCLDIGVGATCIYPILGVATFGWEFVGSDISAQSIACAQKIVDNNTILKDKISLRLQKSTDKIFDGVILDGEKFDVTLCNPPFHSSAKAANEGTMRKLRNLKGHAVKSKSLNFAGQSNELWCEGGEKAFIAKMIAESERYKTQCKWFTTLVSKEENLPTLTKLIDKTTAKQCRIIEMAVGNKITRILAWRY